MEHFYMKFFVLVIAIAFLQAACKDEDSPVQQEITGSWEQCPLSFFQGGGSAEPYFATTAVHGDTIIYGLGSASVINDLFNRDVWYYTENGWGKYGDFPSYKRLNALCFTIGNKMYLGLGNDPKEQDKGLTDIWEYRRAERTWDSLSCEFPGNGRNGAVSFVLDDRLYYGLGEAGEFYSDMYIFEPLKGWTSFYTERQAYTTVFKLNGEVYSGFGKNAEGYLSTLRKFDPDTKQWQVVYQFDKNQNRVNAFAFVTKEKTGDCVYFIGGKPESTGEDFWWCCRYHFATGILEKVEVPAFDSVIAVNSVHNEGLVFDGEYVWKLMIEE